MNPVLSYLYYVTISGRYGLRKVIDKSKITWEVLMYLSGSYNVREFGTRELAENYIKENDR
jgi:isopentenyl diphosphate isomerase/L-lactate dehydrogenase-like FMN-dependent dehydrogenase